MKPAVYAATGAVSNDRPFPYFDALFVALAMLFGLLPVVLGSATGLGFVLLPALYCYYRADRIWPLIGRVWPIFLLPLLALFSAAWSDYPGTTLYYGTQFFLTVLLATMIGAGTDPDEALLGLFAAFLVHGVWSFLLAFQQQSLIVFGSGYPLVALAGSKNATADMAGLGVLTALAMFGSAMAGRRLILALIALGLAAIDLLVLLSAQSAGANAAVAIGAIVLVGLGTIKRLPRAGRTVVAIVAAIFAAVAAATRSIWLDPLFERFLTAAGKDEQLTGRTYLWERAQVLIEQNPLIGRGFATFWRHGDLESEAIWERMHIASRYGFNFHNSFYEVTVYLGYAGLALFLAIFALFVVLLLVRTILEPRAITILLCGVIAYQTLRMPFEALPLVIFAHTTLFIYGALAHAVGLELARSDRLAMAWRRRVRAAGVGPPALVSD